jgi:hypothetical protein
MMCGQLRRLAAMEVTSRKMLEATSVTTNATIVAMARMTTCEMLVVASMSSEVTGVTTNATIVAAPTGVNTTVTAVAVAVAAAVATTAVAVATSDGR